MAKGNLFLGMAKGKVGSIVFSRAFNQQITRTKPTSVKNPKTIGQNTQRAILATIAKSAAAMSALVDHSFVNVTYGPESVRHFRKINMGLLRNLYMNTQDGANLTSKGGNFVPNPLKVSEGNLPSFVGIVNTGDIGFLQDIAHTLPSTGDINVSTFLQSFPYLQGGDQITLVKIMKINDGEMINGDALFTMALDRIVFAPGAFDDTDATIIPDGDGVISNRFLDMTKTTNSSCISLNTATGGLGFSVDVDNKVFYAALILSRKVNNTWQRSAQVLEQINFNDHTDNESAIASYGANDSLAEATEYLNQAEEDESVSGEKGAYMYAATKVGSSDAERMFINAGESASKALTAASGTMVSIDAQAYAPTGKRVITVEVDRPDGSYAAHGASSVHYNVSITSKTAGNWKVVALFSDGTRSEYTITLTVQA